MIAFTFISGVKLGAEIIWDMHNMIVIDLVFIRVFVGSKKALLDVHDLD